MRHNEFHIGLEFRCGGKRWRCTDLGTRVIVPIPLEPHEVVEARLSAGGPVAVSERRFVTDEPSWLRGPPFAIPEQVFDEHELAGCSPASAR